MVYNKVVLLDRLIEDLSDLSRLEAGQLNLSKGDINVEQWLIDIHNKFEYEILQADRKYVPMKITAHEFNHFICTIDIDRMDQVLSNLIWNAIRHTSNVDGEISLKANIVKNEVVIQVQDNGEGISEDALPFIFKRFYKDTTPINSRESTGTGLGLAIVKEIIHAHQGRVWVESKLNQGSIFYITLPVRKRGRVN